MKQPTLRTRRLTLRPFTATDAAVVEPLASLKEVADTTLRMPHPYPVGAAAEWIASHPAEWESGTAATFAILEGGEFRGGISLTLEPEHRRGELGYWIAPEHWGKGIATEAVVEMIRFGFEALGLTRIQAMHFTRNPSSGRVMVKAGMTLEGIHRAYYRKNGVFEDVARYAIVKGDPA